MDKVKLANIAKEASNNAYAPYSNFKVGASLVTKDNKVYKGCNVENASYGAGVCAERSAILTAISNGYKKYDFREMYVMTSGNKISTSCFLCRQVLSELFEKDVKIHFLN